MRLPADDELIAYLDGELPPEKREEMRQLIAASWETRNRLAAIERDIQLYMDATVYHPEPQLPPAHRVWETIAPQLAERTPVQNWWRYATVAVIVIAAFASIALRRETPAAPVSAVEALARAERSEAASVSGVVRRTLQVSRRRSGQAEVQSAVWEVWRASGSARVRHQPQPPLIEEVRSALARNGFDADRPLSAAAYSSWRRSIQPAGESVDRRDTGFELRTTRAAERGLVEASMTFRPSDFHPIAQRLTVRTDSGPELYELREMDLRVVAFDSLPRNLFEPAVTVPPPPSVVPAPPSGASELSILPHPGDLLAAALTAHAALHRSGDCATEHLEIVRQSPDRVDIRGTVPSSERKARLLDALADLPLLRLDIQVAESVSKPAVNLEQMAAHLRLAEPDVISLLALLEAITSDAEALRRHTAGIEVPAGSLVEGFGKAIEEHLAALRINLAHAARILDPAIEPGQGAGLSPAAFAASVLRSCSVSAAGESRRETLAAGCAALSRQAR
ncbi:MAG: hypothetical protein U0R19_12740 [Bryobacteraceae bacterium]